MQHTSRTVVVAPDSFKGTCTAAGAAAAMAAGLRSALGPGVTVIECPLADGGEGTLDVLATGLSAEVLEVDTVDAIGRPRSARIAVSADGATGVIEAAEANGLPLVADVELRPMDADSHGVGLLARHLLDDDVTDILLCIGGTASNDGGIGFLTALGARFVDENGDNVARGAAGLAHIRSIDLSALHPRAREVRVRVALDVDNPLLGPRGAAAVFGPQKGASAEQVRIIDAGLANLATVIAEATGIDVTTISGGGAAGGMPACLAGFLDVEFMPGSDMVMTAVGFAQLCENADLVVTGEGSFDSQSLDGKVVAGVVRTVPSNCPVVVIAGRVVLSPEEARKAGVTAALSIASGPASLSDMSSRTAELIRDTAWNVGSMFQTFTRTTA